MAVMGAVLAAGRAYLSMPFFLPTPAQAYSFLPIVYSGLIYLHFNMASFFCLSSIKHFKEG
jgi:hypothetical protein